MNPCLLGLKALFLEEFRSSTKKLEGEVPNSLNHGSITSSSAPKDSNDRGREEDTRPQIRANSIPRPRAVLSSPDNDELIGSNARQRIGERTSRLKPHQPSHKCNANTKHSSCGRPKSGSVTPEETSDKNGNRGNKVLVTAIRIKE